MTTVGIHELKTNVDEIVHRVHEKGEVFEIALNGEVIARLVPVRVIATPAEQLDSLWAEMDRLAEEITIKWTGSHSALEAVREGRR